MLIKYNYFIYTYVGANVSTTMGCNLIICSVIVQTQARGSVAVPDRAAHGPEQGKLQGHSGNCHPGAHTPMQVPQCLPSRAAEKSCGSQETRLCPPSFISKAASLAIGEGGSPFGNKTQGAWIPAYF